MGQQTKNKLSWDSLKVTETDTDRVCRILQPPLFPIEQNPDNSRVGIVPIRPVPAPANGM